jgi:hypothetical protein
MDRNKNLKHCLSIFLPYDRCPTLDLLKQPYLPTTIKTSLNLNEPPTVVAACTSQSPSNLEKACLPSIESCILRTALAMRFTSFVIIKTQRAARAFSNLLNNTVSCRTLRLDPWLFHRVKYRLQSGRSFPA